MNPFTVVVFWWSFFSLFIVSWHLQTVIVFTSSFSIYNSFYLFLSDWCGLDSQYCVNKSNESQFSCLVVSDSFWLHESQHARPPCPSPTPRVYSDSCPLSRWCHPAISCLLLLPPIPPSIRVFSSESTLRKRWPEYWSFSFSISPSIEHPGLISFRMDWLDLLVVQGTLKSLLHHHSSKASIFRRSAFFTLQLSHPYMTTGKTIALTRRTFVGKVIVSAF